jgi:hypothetical protein
MIDERFAARVATWLRRTDRTSRRAHDNVAHAMAQIRHTRQQRRRLWFLPGPKPTAGARDEPDRATRPYLPTVTPERTTTMFSAVKLVAIAASIALAGALALALPASQPEGPAPGAESAAAAAELTPFTGMMLVRSTDRAGDRVEHDWGIARMDQQWTFEYDLDDERLNGMGRSRVNNHQITGSNGGPKSYTLYIENDGGSWVGTGRAYNGVNGGGWHHQMVLTGQGAYEGLAAILSADQHSMSSVLEVSGVVFTGGLPALPEPAPTDFE